MTKKITISKQDIEDAARQGAMAPRDVESLWQQLLQQKGGAREVEANSGFDFAQLAWYGGGVLVMIAMAWFMERAGSVFGTGSVFMLSLDYAVGFAALGHKLRFKDGQKTPGGLLFTLAVLMAPLAVVSGLDMGEGHRQVLLSRQVRKIRVGQGPAGGQPFPAVAGYGRHPRRHRAGLRRASDSASPETGGGDRRQR